MQNKRSKKLEVLLQFTIYNLRFTIYNLQVGERRARRDLSTRRKRQAVLIADGIEC